MADTDNNQNTDLTDFTAGYPMAPPPISNAAAYQAAQQAAAQQSASPPQQLPSNTPAASINVPASAYGQATPAAQPQSYDPNAQPQYVQPGGEIPGITRPPAYQMLPTEDSPEMKQINTQRLHAAMTAISNHVNGVHQGSKLGAIAKIGGLALMGGGLATGNPFLAIGGAGLVRGQRSMAEGQKAKEEAQYQEALKTVKELDEHHEKFGLEPMTKNNEGIQKAWNQQLEAHKAAEADQNTANKQQMAKQTFEAKEAANKSLERHRTTEEGIAQGHLDLAADQLGLNQKQFESMDAFRKHAQGLNDAQKELSDQKFELQKQEATVSNLMKMGELTKAGLQIEQQKEQTAMQHNAEVGKMKMQWDKIHPNESMPAEFGQFMRVNPQNGFLDIVGQMQQAAQPQAEQAPTRPQGMQAQAQSLPATPKVPSMATKPKAQETKATAPKQIAENYVKSKGIGMTELKAKAWALAQKKGYTYSEFHALWKKQGI